MYDQSVCFYVSLYFLTFKLIFNMSSFYYALPCVHSSFAIILIRKRKLAALLLLSYRCGAFRGIRDLGRTAIYIQGAGEHW